MEIICLPYASGELSFPGGSSLFPEFWRAPILSMQGKLVLSEVEYNLLIQTDSGAVTDPVAVRGKKRKNAHRLPPQSLFLCLTLPPFREL